MSEPLSRLTATRHALLAGLALLCVFVSACGDDGEGSAPAATATRTPANTASATATRTFTATETLPPSATPTATRVAASFTVIPGVESVTVINAPPGAQLNLYDASGRAMIGEITDQLGQAVFAYIPNEFLVIQTGQGVQIPTNQGRTLKRGDGYVIRNVTADPPEESEPFSVLGRDDVPPTSLYERQVINEGFNYIEMRDGVTLSATVWFPDERLWPRQENYPTVIEYSGYSPSNPNGKEPGTMIANLLGYAVVGVNMRGSGCSGGTFDVFNPAQHADGYDVIETIARQPWVRHHKVGMIGLSYSGISQLFVASTAPPSLAAITPLSVIEDPWHEQWPGGIYNGGFTKQWLEQRDRSNAPGGNSWVTKRIEEGDTICEENQKLHGQNPDFEQFGRVLEFYPPDEDDRRLSLLARRINVPVYLTGAWQDEQTGGNFATMLDDFDSTDRKKFILYNGHHPDGYSPSVLTRWYEFLEFYVARRIPRLPEVIRLAAPAVFEDFFNVPGLGFEPDRFPGIEDYEQALALYEAEPQVRVLFEVGANHPVAGATVPRYEASFPSWPPPDATARTWYLGPDEQLLDEMPTDDESDRYQHDEGAGEDTYTTLGAYDFIDPTIPYEWPPLPDGFGLSYLTAPFAEDVVVVGNGGYANLWFATEVTDANVEVTLTEIYPDGTEVIIQSGLLRLGHRVLDPDLSDSFTIEYSYREEDFQPLVPGQFIEVKVPFRPFSHAFRAGSRMRLIISTPGRDSPLWAYENPNYGRPVFHQVGRSAAYASSLVLPTVDGIPIPEGYPPCPSLRGQICRPFVPLENEAVE